MKKFLLSVACLCLLAVLVPAAKLNAATLPWDDSTDVKGTVQIGSTMTVDAAKTVTITDGYYDDEGNWIDEPREVTESTVAYFELNAVAGQSYYIAGAEKDEVSVSVQKLATHEFEDYQGAVTQFKYGEDIGVRNLYATTNETWYIRLSNSESTSMSLSLVAGQTFEGTVTKNDYRYGDCYYYFKPVLSGEYTFEMTSSDADDPDLDFGIGYMKRGKFWGLSDKDIRSTTTYDKRTVTANLQAGQQYVIQVDSESYAPYTLALTQAPTVSVDKVVAKKAVSKKAKKAVVTWKKVKGASGYEITYSLKKNYKKAKTVKVSAKKAKVTLKKLKRGKTYYVKVRAFKTVEGNDYFGAYSKTMKVKVK